MRDSSGWRHTFSRRRFLRNSSALAAARALHPLLHAQAPHPQNLPVFEEVLPSASGITWVHNAGKSAAKYFPETSGAGCAFLDFDNDGWMDIYLVNSGRCDLYTPPQPLQNALYRNNR